jgi:hypothetical protein
MKKINYLIIVLLISATSIFAQEKKSGISVTQGIH